MFLIFALLAVSPPIKERWEEPVTKTQICLD